MKKHLVSILVILFIGFLYNTNKVNSEEIIIPHDAIRLRVLANSNEENDQKIKMQLSIKLESKIQELLKDINNSEEARSILKNNLNTLNNYISSILKENNYSGTYTLTIGDTFFPEKKFNGIVYEKGYYETFLITLGEGKGNNWWCVLFPPLCLMEAEESSSNDIQYKFYIKEILNKYF